MIPAPPPDSPAPEPLAVGRREAALMLGISERLLWTLTQEGQIPHVRIASRVLYPVAELRRWLEDRSRASVSAASDS